MAAEFGFIAPTGAVVANPKAIAVVREFQVETATGMYPGVLVKKGSTAAEVVVNDTSSNECVGWLGYEQASLDDRPDTVDTIWTINKSAPVLNGPGMMVRAWLSGVNTVTIGEALRPAAYRGSLDEGTPGTDNIVAIALQDVSNAASALSGTLEEIWVVSLI